MLNLKIQKLGDASHPGCGPNHISLCRHLAYGHFATVRVRALVFDLADINAVDSAGLGVLVSLRAWARKTGTALKLMNMHPRVEKFLQLTKLSSHLVPVRTGNADLLCRAIHDTESGYSNRPFKIQTAPTNLKPRFTREHANRLPLPALFAFGD